MLEWDARRQLEILPSTDDAIEFATEHWVHSAKRAIQQHGRFAVALSGGSTPKAIYRQLLAKHKENLDWSKVYLFWSDERAVGPDHPDSNYKMAMDSGFGQLPIPPSQIFRLKGEGDLKKNAESYQNTIQTKVGPNLFDLVMLGIGEDGHTASLFPKTAALEEKKLLVVPNYLPENNNWRITFTFPCINKSDRAVIYAMGESKQSIVALILEAAILSPFPASAIGTADHKALWILDQAASRLIKTQ